MRTNSWPCSPKRVSRQSAAGGKRQVLRSGGPRGLRDRGLRSICSRAAAGALQIDRPDLSRRQADHQSGRAPREVGLRRQPGSGALAVGHGERAARACSCGDARAGPAGPAGGQGDGLRHDPLQRGADVVGTTAAVKAFVGNAVAGLDPADINVVLVEGPAARAPAPVPARAPVVASNGFVLSQALPPILLASAALLAVVALVRRRRGKDQNAA